MHGGRLPETLFWKYLEARHDLHPHRFDRWHPTVGHWIECDERTAMSFPPPSGPPCHHSSVPEPSTLILGIVAILSVIARKVWI